MDIEAIRAEALTCTKCRLAETRTQVVWADGNLDSEVCIIGEAPGFNEDKQGEPFVGAAGQLLNRLLEGIGLRREDVYIANVIKCRPPNNRDPAQDEVDSCKDYLRAQITLIDPNVVVTLGNFATKLLMRTETGITRLRGRSYPWWQGRVLIPTYHPAAALRSGERLIGEMQSDFSLVREELSKPRITAAPAQQDVSDSEAPRTEEDPEQMNLFA